MWVCVCVCDLALHHKQQRGWEKCKGVQRWCVLLGSARVRLDLARARARYGVPRLSLAWGPAHLASAQHMDVDVVDRLASVGPLVHHQTVAFGKAHLVGTLLGHDHQVTQQLQRSKAEMALVKKA